LDTERLRILHVLPTRAMEYGGPVTVAEHMVDELLRLGVKAAIFPSKVENSNRSCLSVWKELDHTIAGSDIVHIHGLWNFHANFAAHAAQWRRTPFLVTPHGMLDRWALRRSRLKKIAYGFLFERRNLRKAARVQFFNDEELIESQDFEPRLKAFVLPNGVQTDLWRSVPGRNAFLETHPEFRGRVVVLFLGRLHPKKGFDLLIPAFATVSQRINGLHLVIAGPDENGYRQKIEEMVKQCGVSDQVTFTGMVQGETKREILAASDFFILTSHQEGDSIAVKEAMAAGLPVIITNSCHFNEVAQEGAGIVVPQDIKEITKALEKMATEAQREEMGKRAANLIAKHYTWTRIVEQLLETYKEILISENPKPINNNARNNHA